MDTRSTEASSFQDDPDITRQANTENEPIMFCEKVQKLNRWSIKQERMLILTTESIYSFRKKTLRRKMPI